MSTSQPVRRVIQIELNEVSNQIIEKLRPQGILPCFDRLSREWSFLQTTSETKYELIEPWIQWITAHTGKSFSEHQVFHLADVDELQYPQIWEVLSHTGIESAIVGSMNAARGSRTRGGLFFPDPWAKNGRTYPESLQPMWDIISAKVQGHAVSEIAVTEMAKVFATTFKYGIGPGLYLRIAKQLLAQRMDSLTKWRLAGLFDEFLSEIFLHILDDNRFRFCTLFLNSVAHYQHHYWRNFEPEKFSPSVMSPDCRSSDNPVEYGYRLYDKILSRILNKLDLERDVVIVVSGLSQVPYTESESQGGMNYYRLIDHQAFLNAIGLEDLRAFPMMSRDWQVRYENAAEKELILQKLGSLSVAGEHLFRLGCDRDGFIFVETSVTKRVRPDDWVYRGEMQVVLFGHHFRNIAVKSGHHTGIGSLWISNKNLIPIANQSIPLTEVFDLGIRTLAPEALTS